MPLSWNEIKSRAVEFSKEWEDEKSEDAEAKSFWDGFFAVFGITRRRLAHFEVQVKKYGGSQGFIDLFWPGMLLVEHKSLGRDLEKARQQAFDYFPGIAEKDLPKYILVSDFEKFILYDLEENVSHEFLLKELSKKVSLFGFIAGYKKQQYKEEDQVNIQAAEKMGKIYDSMLEAGYVGHELNVFLVRILFCFFADDANVFSINGQFRRYLENRTNLDGSDLGMHLGMIFQVLNTPKEKRQITLDEELKDFEYVNGGLFAENIPLPAFTSKMRQSLLEARAFDWSKISPAIFGSLFQSVMDKDARRHLGAHYTSEKNILKLIQPLFLDELKAELKGCGKNISKLNAFQEKLSKLKFLDPACGCGNFLIIAYRELRLLELEVLRLHYGENSMLPWDVKGLIRVRPEQFFGMEIEEFPAKITETAMWLMDHQMNELASRTFGRNIPDLPLGKGAEVFVGNALQKKWEEIVAKNELSYILGNPPFIGSKMMTKQQREDIILVFGKIKGAGVLDYVSGWYVKAAQYIQGTKIKCAFVSTNSITQGEQVGILWKELLENYGVKIHFAHKTFKWSNEARGKAAVYCVIIGFAGFDVEKKFIYEYEDIKGEAHEVAAKNVNPYLVDAENLLIYNKQKPICNVPEIGIGNQPIDGGFYLFTPEEKINFVKEEPFSEKFFKKWIGGAEFINNSERWCLCLKDVSPEKLKRMPKVITLIEKVRDFRLRSRRKSTLKLADTPTKYQVENFPEENYLVIPEVNPESRKYIPIGYMSPNVLASNLVKIVPAASFYNFGVLQSEMHMTWVKYVCGRLGNGYRYSKDIVYNNFPWPENPSKEKVKAVEKAGQEVLEARKKYPESSLADLYDPLTMPADLVKAHQNLDRAVDAAYGRKVFKNSAQRMEFLFGEYKKCLGNKK